MKNILFLLILSGLFSLTCTITDPPQPDDQKLTLTFEDASCTEAWITIATQNLQLPLDLNLTVTDAGGNLKSQSLNLKAKDSLIYIDSLLPNKTYKFKAELSGIQDPLSSNEITATTLDTTSHDFTWQSWTFGDVGSSVLYDVAIINENNIWAVGEINIADSSANGYTTYNAVHWNGSEWKLKRIIVNFRGFTITPTLEGIFAFSPTQIWLAGGLTIYGDGINWTPYDVRLITGIDELSLSKIWGSSPNNMYFIGRNGNLAHYNGIHWTRIESGTNLNINDIWGDYNEKTNEWEILAVASNILQSLERDLLKIKDNLISHLSTEPIRGTLRSIWSLSNRIYFLGGGGIYQKKSIVDSLWQNDPFEITGYSTNRIRGDAANNIAATGGVGELLHFNGFRWQSYISQTMLNAGNFYGIAIKEDIIIAAGVNNAKAVITMGKR